MTVLDDYKANTDLVSLIESDLGQEGRRSGRWVQYRCPFGHEDKHPSLAVTLSGHEDQAQYWKCFACGESGTAVDWLLKYRRMTMPQVLEHIKGNQVSATPLPYYKQAQVVQTDESWQASAVEVMQNCEHELWNSAAGERALRWLTGPERMLTEGNIQAWNIGFSHGENIAGLKVAYGILIPCYENGLIHYLKIRRPAGKPKYIKVAGSQPGLFGADTMLNEATTFVTEGEFDAMVIWHALGQAGISAGVVTPGSATDTIDPNRWGRYFLTCRHVIAVYDMDEAGERGYQRLATLSNRVTRAAFPNLGSPVKDVTDYVTAGGDLPAWIRYQIEQCKEIESLRFL